ncbi:hypothetical protein [Nocardioides sambongensis]|uniref:hypothetical protein n=1 Tax=Nocardioides sambongensis TaxID=2589074 RepID=UPI001E36150A|nr:hypothetical protein [Nocardioides sambongensis]
MKARLAWAAYGILATLTGLGLAHLVAALTVPATSPVLAVGSAVIDLTPTPMKEWAIRTFGSADKVILVGSVLVGVVVLAGVAGVLARRRVRYGAALLLLLVAVAGTAVLSRPAAAVTDLLPCLVATVAGVGALLWLARAQHRVDRAKAGAGAGAPAADDPDGTPATDDTTHPAPALTAGRRGLLVAVGALGALAAAGGAVGRLVSNLRLRPEDITLPSPTDPAKTFPAAWTTRSPGSPRSAPATPTSTASTPGSTSPWSVPTTGR